MLEEVHTCVLAGTSVLLAGPLLYAFATLRSVKRKWVYPLCRGSHALSHTDEKRGRRVTCY